jgi:hypothetical protein
MHRDNRKKMLLDTLVLALLVAGCIVMARLLEGFTLASMLPWNW